MKDLITYDLKFLQRLSKNIGVSTPSTSTGAVSNQHN
jgi:hypothetical protein